MGQYCMLSLKVQYHVRCALKYPERILSADGPTAKRGLEVTLLVAAGQQGDPQSRNTSPITYKLIHVSRAHYCVGKWSPYWVMMNISRICAPMVCASTDSEPYPRRADVTTVKVGYIGGRRFPVAQRAYVLQVPSAPLHLYEEQNTCDLDVLKLLQKRDKNIIKCSIEF